MSKAPTPPRIGIYGSEEKVTTQSRGCCLWSPGYAAAVTAAGGTPVLLQMRPGCSWDELLDEVDGVLFGERTLITPRQQSHEERLCEWCQELGLPLLAVDHGMHVLNTTYGGTLYSDLPSELPEALQHRHPPEPGVRHAIAVTQGTRLAGLYGEGEIVVNSEHYRAVSKVGARLPGQRPSPGRRHRGHRDRQRRLVRPGRPMASGLGQCVGPRHSIVPRP